LTGHDALRAGDGGCGLGDVDVVENHRSRLPAELECDASDAFTTDRTDLATGGRRPREGDLVDPRVAHQQL
jgi:hypothetical protein